MEPVGTLRLVRDDHGWLTFRPIVLNKKDERVKAVKGFGTAATLEVLKNAVLAGENFGSDSVMMTPSSRGLSESLVRAGVARKIKDKDDPTFEHYVVEAVPGSYGDSV